MRSITSSATGPGRRLPTRAWLRIMAPVPIDAAGPDVGRPEVEIRVVDVDSPSARALERRHVDEMARRYRGSGPALLEAQEYVAPQGCFVVAFVEGVAVACGGFRYLSAGVAEIKRMYVDPTVRRRGIGALDPGLSGGAGPGVGIPRSVVGVGERTTRCHLLVRGGGLRTESRLRGVQGRSPQPVLLPAPGRLTARKLHCATIPPRSREGPGGVGPVPLPGTRARSVLPRAVPRP